MKYFYKFAFIILTLNNMSISHDLGLQCNLQNIINTNNNMDDKLILDDLKPQNIINTNNNISILNNFESNNNYQNGTSKEDIPILNNLLLQNTCKKNISIPNDLILQNNCENITNNPINSELIQDTVNIMKIIQCTSCLHNNINLLIQCFKPNNKLKHDDDKVSIFFNKRKLFQESFINELSKNFINVHSENENTTSELYTMIKFVYDNNFKKALEQNNEKEILNILDFFKNKIVNIKEEMNNNKKLIENMSKSNKDDLKKCLINYFFDTILDNLTINIEYFKNINRAIENIGNNINNFENNQNIKQIKTIILEISNDILCILDKEKECVLKLGIKLDNV